MINFDELYEILSSEIAGNQKRLSVNSILGVYFGLSPEGNMRLSFVSAKASPKLESTKMLKVSQGFESGDVYWTCFDLLVSEEKKLFFTFCGNLIDAIIDCFDETRALQLIKKRYITWKTMFKKEPKEMGTREVQQGLFGELFFLKNEMIDEYGVEGAIQSWSGSEKTSKDFSINDDWFEIKTIGANTPTVHISSLAQLSSNKPGKLVIIRVETMSAGYDNGESCIGELFQDILSKINDETLEGIFLSKISACGFDVMDDNFMTKYSIKSMDIYKVDDSFPRLKEKDITFTEICDVEYSLIVNALKPFKENN